MVQDGVVEVAALHLVHQPRLDVRVALVVDVADAVALPFEPREVFEQRRFFVDAGHHRLRDEAVAAEKENLVDRFGIALGLHDLLQIAAQFLITRGPVAIGGADAARIDVGTGPLGRFGGQRIVKTSGMDAVASQRGEFEAEIVVEPVGGDRRLPAVERYLVHFECAREVLGVAHHHYRDVADEHGAFDRGFRLLPELAEHLPERVGLARAVDDEVYFQTAFPDFGGVVIDLPAGFFIAPGVDHHGEAAAGRSRKKLCGSDCRHCCREEYFLECLHVWEGCFVCQKRISAPNVNLRLSVPSSRSV